MATDNYISVSREARMIAFQVLYEEDTVGHEWREVSSRYLDDRIVSADVTSNSYNLLRGVTDNRDELDHVISGLAPMWPVSQISAVDRNLLRLGVYEITIGKESPTKLVINEIVELAKMFGSDSSFKFINGVLASLVNPKRLVAG